MEKRQIIRTILSKKSMRVVLCLFIPVFFVTILSFAKGGNKIYEDIKSSNEQVVKESIDEQKEEIKKDEIKKDELVNVVEVSPKEELKQEDSNLVQNEQINNNYETMVEVYQQKSDETMDYQNEFVEKNTNIVVGNRQIDPLRPMVALTFDDGPNKIRTNKILDILERHNAVATFFELGYLVERNKETVIREESLGCEVGNHSYEHKNLDKLTGFGIRKDIKKSEIAFYNALGHKTKLFRAPYGNANSKVRNNVNYPIIKWDVDTLDWKFRDKEKILTKLREVKDYDGRIILMHSLYNSTVDAVDVIVPELLEKGYQLVTVSELAYYKGYNVLENGKVFCNFN